MMDSIQIVNKNGDGMITEGLSYLEIPSTGKKYLLYTLNEKVDNDLTKIYITETSDQVGGANPIANEDWDNLRKKMIKISHKEEVEDVNFLNAPNTSFNVGDPKKLAITTVAKQAFKDVWKTHTISNSQTSVSTNNGSAGSFFNADVVGEKTEDVAPQAPTQSIFDNPPQPIISDDASTQVVEQPGQIQQVPVTNQVTPTQDATVQSIATNQIASTPVNDNPVLSPEPVIANPIIENAQQTENVTNIQTPLSDVPVISGASEPATIQPVTQPISTVSEQPIEQPITETPQIINPTPVEPSVTQTPVMQTVAMETPVMQTPEIKIENINQNSKIITDDEALNAINIIQEYITQEEKNA